MNQQFDDLYLRRLYAKLKQNGQDVTIEPIALGAKDFNTIVPLFDEAAIVAGTSKLNRLFAGTINWSIQASPTQISNERFELYLQSVQQPQETNEPNGVFKVNAAQIFQVEEPITQVAGTFGGATQLAGTPAVASALITHSNLVSGCQVVVFDSVYNDFTYPAGFGQWVFTFQFVGYVITAI